MADLKQLVINLRPAPDVPKFTDETPREVQEAFQNLVRWCRDTERAIHILKDAHNQGV